MKENHPSFLETRLVQYRLALLPVARNIKPSTCIEALIDGGPAFLDLVLFQEVGPLWHYRLQAGDVLGSLPAASINALRLARMSATAGYLQQRMALEQIDQHFAAQNIPYLVIKGAHVRECVYPDPALRPANDMDILVSPQDRQRAAHTLLELGYTYHENTGSISHEALFNRGRVDIDLHWHLMRPGRTRIDMTEGYLARRQRSNGYWGLSDSDTVFLMLTHPAFVRYVCSPNMGLGRVADFLLWIQHRQVDWSEVVQLLELAGLKTAAWTMLSWFRMLAQPDTAKGMDDWLDTVCPNRLRAVYLGYWLTHDLPTRWFQRPLLIQVGFTLFLHDRLTDALHAVQGLWQAKRQHVLNARQLMGDEE